MFAGTKITIDGESLILPPISLGQLRSGTLDRLREHDRLVSEGKPFDAMDIRGEVLFAAFQRNYPTFSKEKFLSFLDLGNIGSLWRSVLGESGFTPGEAQAVTETETGTSSQSTEASPPLTGGPIAK
jgi:hypothetical protein